MSCFLFKGAWLAFHPFKDSRKDLTYELFAKKSDSTADTRKAMPPKIDPKADSTERRASLLGPLVRLRLNIARACYATSGRFGS